MTRRVRPDGVLLELSSGWGATPVFEVVGRCAVRFQVVPSVFDEVAGAELTGPIAVGKLAGKVSDLAAAFYFFVANDLGLAAGALVNAETRHYNASKSGQQQFGTGRAMPGVVILQALTAL